MLVVVVSFCRRSCFSAVELVVIFLTGLLDFSVAVVLSAGLDHTCSAFGRAAGEDQPYVMKQRMSTSE